jgi:hypothetical protein
VGRPKARFLRLADAAAPGAELRWRSVSGGARGARRAAVVEISTAGAGTPGFARHPPPPGALALSLVFEDETSLNLSTANTEQHALWRVGLRADARAARGAAEEAEEAAAGNGGGHAEAGAPSLSRLSAGSATSSFASCLLLLYPRACWERRRLAREPRLLPLPARARRDRGAARGGAAAARGRRRARRRRRVAARARTRGV